MKNHQQQIIAAGLAAFVVVIHGTFSSAAEPLNVVFILVDDLGWSDLGYASDFYETPNVDALAKSNLNFTRAYAAAPVCSPTRAAIMTGKFPARLDMTIWHEGAVSGGPKNRRLRDAKAEPNLPREELTLAELFRSAGYFTAHIGKWHLGSAAYYPETQGFDVNIGGTFWGAPSTFFFPFAGRWNARDPEFRYVPGLAPGAEGDYLPDRLTDKALELIDAVNDRPFFLNLWYHTVHSPIEAPADAIERYRPKRPGKHHKDPTYAAMVERMDFNVGRVLDKLAETDLADKTIVIFTSDNGGVDFDQRSILPTSNLPLRSGKGTLYEGGLRVPLIVRWPGVTSPGLCKRLISSQDFFPTFAEHLSTQTRGPVLTGEKADGVSLLSLLKEPATQLNRPALYWHFPHYYPRMTPASAIRKGRWKLIHFYEDDLIELYDLHADPGETRNLAKNQPSVAEDLKRDLDTWRREVGANEPVLP